MGHPFSSVDITKINQLEQEYELDFFEIDFTFLNDTYVLVVCKKIFSRQCN